MATRKYKKQRKGNLKKKSLGKKKRSMKKRGKSLKKRGGGDGDDLLIKPLANRDILPWAAYVNPLYNSLKSIYEKRNPNTDIVNIPEIYKNRINEIYNRDNGKSLIQNFNDLSKGIITLEACRYTIRLYISEQKKFEELVCQAIKVMIYSQIIKQIDNIILDKNKNYAFYTYTNIPDMQNDKEVEQIYETEENSKKFKIYSKKEIEDMKGRIYYKFIEHLGRVIKDFLKFYPHVKYPKDKNTIEDQLDYYNDVISKKILNTDSNFDNIKIVDIY